MDIRLIFELHRPHSSLSKGLVRKQNKPEGQTRGDKSTDMWISRKWTRRNMRQNIHIQLKTNIQHKNRLVTTAWCLYYTNPILHCLIVWWQQTGFCTSQTPFYTALLSGDNRLVFVLHTLHSTLPYGLVTTAWFLYYTNSILHCIMVWWQQTGFWTTQTPFYTALRSEAHFLCQVLCHYSI